MKILGVNAIFHDSAAAVVVDGQVVAAAEEERFSRRKHAKRPVPFSAWELPELAMRWCLKHAQITPDELDAVAYSFDPAIALPQPHDPFDVLRIDYAKRAPQFLAQALPGLDPSTVVYVQHHVAHAASAGLGGPYRNSAVLVNDGRGERHSHLSGSYDNGVLEILHRTALPDSLGLLYESLTEHLGFERSSDEYKVMALASYGEPRFLQTLRQGVFATDDGGFRAQIPDWHRFAPRRATQPCPPEQSNTDTHKNNTEQSNTEQSWIEEYADLAASVQTLIEEVLLEQARWLQKNTEHTTLTLAGGTALNCVANSTLWREGLFEQVWVQPASGDSGTALGAALHVAQQAGQLGAPSSQAGQAVYTGRGWSDQQLADWLNAAAIPFTTPQDLPAQVAKILADDGIVAWFDGRAEFGPRALGHRSLLANPSRLGTLQRLNEVKGREQFRPVAPMVLAQRAGDIFLHGPLPSPYMLFVHTVAPSWRSRIPAVTHVDGTARVQTVDAGDNPRIAALLEAFESRTGVPVLVNTSLNTAGRPMVDDPRDALELFGSAPVAALVMGPHVVRRAQFALAEAHHHQRPFSKQPDNGERGHTEEGR